MHVPAVFLHVAERGRARSSATPLPASALGVCGDRGKSCDLHLSGDRAGEAYALTEAMTVAEAKREMLAIATAYQRLAEHAGRTAGR